MGDVTLGWCHALTGKKRESLPALFWGIFLVAIRFRKCKHWPFTSSIFLPYTWRGWTLNPQHQPSQEIFPQGTILPARLVYFTSCRKHAPRIVILRSPESGKDFLNFAIFWNPINFQIQSWHLLEMLDQQLIFAKGNTWTWDEKKKASNLTENTAFDKFENVTVSLVSFSVCLCRFHGQIHEAWKHLNSSADMISGKVKLKMFHHFWRVTPGPNACLNTSRDIKSPKTNKSRGWATGLLGNGIGNNSCCKIYKICLIQNSWT